MLAIVTLHPFPPVANEYLVSRGKMYFKHEITHLHSYFPACLVVIKFAENRDGQQKLRICILYASSQ